MYKKLLRDFKIEYAGAQYTALRTPCTLYRALSEGGKLERLDYGLNLRGIESLSNLPFSISCRFFVSEELLSYPRVVLKIAEIDAPCTIFVGETDVAEITDNAPVHIIDILDALNLGDNILTFAFSAPSERMKISYSKEELSDVGIFGDVEIIGYHTTFIESVRFNQTHENGKVSLHISCKTHENDDAVATVASIVSPNGRMYYVGLNRGEGDLTITDPMLWFPHTLGKPNLYRVTLTMYVGGEPEDSLTVSLGLREVALSYGNAMGDGEFALTVSGAHFFVSGAEYCPSSLIVREENDSRLEALIHTYVRANINLLYVSERNRHLSTSFYDLCDRYGLLVIQDIPSPGLAANSEEGTRVYLDTLRVGLSLIATHPSLALLHSQLTGEDSIREIPELVKKMAPDAVYTNIIVPVGQPLKSIDTTAVFPGVSSPPSFPAIRSLKQFLPKEEFNPFSNTVETRATSSVSAMLTKASERYPYAMSMAQVVYLSQLSQSDSVRESVEYLRLRRGRAMGMILESTTDSLGRISPSIADAYGKEKALAYTLHDVCAPVAILLQRDGYRVKCYIANETREPFSGTVLYRLLSAKNKVLKEERVAVTAPEDALTLAVSVDFSTQAHKRESEVLVEAVLLHGDTELHSATAFFTEPKRFAYQNPEIEKSIVKTGADYTLILTPRAFAHQVYLDFSDIDASFTRNFFDLTRNAPVRIPFSVKDPKATPESLLEALCVMSVYDIGK